MVEFIFYLYFRDKLLLTQEVSFKATKDDFSNVMFTKALLDVKDEMIETYIKVKIEQVKG